jgi:hypothetical protein
METHGLHAPETVEEARELYESVGDPARVVVREAARAMGFDREEYRDRITSSVVETVRDALFASLLRVHVGDRAAFDAWCDEHPAYEVHEAGSENVDRVAWHAVTFDDSVVAATFQNEPDAAVETVRRQAFGRVYREAL